MTQIYQPPLYDIDEVKGSSDYLTVKQVAEIKGVATSTIYNWMVSMCEDGLPKLPYVIGADGRRFINKKYLPRVFRTGNSGRIRRRDINGNYLMTNFESMNDSNKKSDKGEEN